MQVAFVQQRGGGDDETTSEKINDNNINDIRLLAFVFYESLSELRYRHELNSEQRILKNVCLTK